MSSPTTTKILLHGTTRRRAEQIVALGPDPRFREPGGQPIEDDFSMDGEQGPFLFGEPEECPFGKSRVFR